MFLMRSRDPQLSRDTLKNATASRGVPIAVSALIDFVVVILFAFIGGTPLIMFLKPLDHF